MLRQQVHSMSRPLKFHPATAVRNSRPGQTQKITSLSRGKKIEEPQFLSGWKDIANYLGRGVRTVQRYERYMGFPVRRPAGRPRAAVIATKAELDAWVAASPIRHEFQLSRSAAGLPKVPSIAGAVKEMHKLVEQTRGLRDELMTSVRVLADTIELLEEESQKKKFEVRLEMNDQAETDRAYGLVGSYFHPVLDKKQVS